MTSWNPHLDLQILLNIHHRAQVATPWADEEIVAALDDECAEGSCALGTDIIHRDVTGMIGYFFMGRESSPNGTLVL